MKSFHFNPIIKLLQRNFQTFLITLIQRTAGALAIGIHERSEDPTTGRNIIMMKIVYVVYSVESNLVHPPQLFDNEHPAWVEARSRPVKTILRKDILGHAGNNFSTFIDFSDPASEPPLIPAGYKQIPTIVTILK
jgi:hypothetical protein